MTLWNGVRVKAYILYYSKSGFAFLVALATRMCVKNSGGAPGFYDNHIVSIECKARDACGGITDPHFRLSYSLGWLLLCVDNFGEEGVYLSWWSACSDHADNSIASFERVLVIRRAVVDTLNLTNLDFHDLRKFADAHAQHIQIVNLLTNEQWFFRQACRS
jgi:hypothetical protein